MIHFLEVIVLKNNLKEKRLINVNHIRQVLEFPNDENKLKLDLLDYTEYLIIESSMKDFKITLNSIKNIK
jgi:hypothetical protein